VKHSPIKSIFCRVDTLDLESTRTTATTSLFELASLGPDIRLDSIVSVRVGDRGRVTKVSLGITSSGSTEKDSVGALGSTECELIKSDALSTGSNDTLSSILGKSKSADRHLRAFNHTDIVGDLSNNHGSLTILLTHVLRKTVETHRRLVDLTHVQTLQDGSTESRVRSASEELVELHQKLGVRVLTLELLHGALVPHAASASFQIDTHDLI
jgi:hypothetical protein